MQIKAIEAKMAPSDDTHGTMARSCSGVRVEPWLVARRRDRRRRASVHDGY